MLTNQQVASLVERLNKGRHDEVIAETSRLIKQYPRVAGLHELLGTAHARVGNQERAEKSLRRALKLMPGLQSALYNLGGLYLNGGNYSQAVAVFRQLAKLDPNNSAVLWHLGEALFHSGLPQDAILPLQRAVALSSELIEARFLLGRIARDAGDDEDAIHHFESVLEIDPAHYEAAFNIGNIHRDHRRNDDAMRCYEPLLSGRPDHLPLLLNMHVCHLQDMRIEEATAVNDRVLALDPGNPNAAFNASSLEFLSGRWQSGYALYEKRFEKEDPVKPQYSGRETDWDGAGPVAGGRLILHAEQGLGDSIMMLRFLALIDSKTENPVVLLQPGLERIAALSFPDIQFETVTRHARGWKKGGERGAAQCSLMSLPHVLRGRWQQLPASAGYLSAPEDSSSDWAAWLGGDTGHPAIGLVWRGNPDNPNDRHRSVDLEMFTERLPSGPRYVVLQKDVTDAECGQLKARDSLDVRFPDLGDFADTAALCGQLDSVIAVDTSVAHLCGALGTRTHLLLPFMPDARWRASGADCDWYDSVTVHRQTITGDWAAPLKSVASHLQDRLQGLKNS